MKVIEYNSNYKKDFIELNLAWINALFQVEEEDEKVLYNIEDYIRNGANVFFTIEDDEVIACCMVEPLRDDMWEISNFEYEGITDEGLAAIDSDIMFKSFEEALIQEAGTAVSGAPYL